MANKNYKKYFDKKMSQAGVSSPKDIPDDMKDDFFKDVDKGYNSKKEKGKDGVKDESNTRAGRLLSFHYGIEEEFYKKNDGNTHSNRKANGLGNVSPRNKSNSSNAASATTSAVKGVNIAKPGVGPAKGKGGDNLTHSKYVS